MVKILLITLALIFVVEAKYLTFSQVHSMPKGVEKNYYIWRYITQKSTTKAEAMRIIKEASFINYALKKAYKKKTGLKPPRVSSRGSGYSTGRAGGGKKPTKNFLKKKAITNKIARSNNPLALWKAQDPSTQVFAFNFLGAIGRARIDHTPTLLEWQKMTQSYGIDKLIKTLMKERLPKFKKALSYPVPEKNNIGYSTLMKLGFYNLQHGRNGVAHKIFHMASKYRKARTIENADRALFWSWRAGKDRADLKKLAESYSINIYSLAGRDILGMKYNLGITPHLPDRKVNYNIKDPLAWTLLKRKIFSKGTNLNALAEKFKSKETVGLYSYIKTRASLDRAQYFPMPYRDYLSKLPVKRQAIIYAIARQESKFVPASVSGSFALGMMQIMPFLVKHLAKQQKELIDLDDMFDPRKALVYSNKHLDYLTKWLHHPLFVAYAYNAGIGYTKRLLKKGNYFHSNRGHEPWLSMERVKNYQANDYGKKVLANYVIYMNKLGYHIRLTDLVNSLTNRAITDRFRKRKK